ncbi:MAG TPA: hypothetical protein VK978_03850 [Candidatus Saccharimonadales bacterium]|nr:hypothetical protein [Candidatus Saccharimonadales bacterium]
MSNFSIFNKVELSKLIEPFLPGATDYITPIKYQALTPDIFALLFRTTGPDNTDYYFVSLEYDYIRDAAEARQLITTWAGSEVSRIMVPSDKDVSEDMPLQDLSAPTTGPYMVMTARIERPTGLGYWSENIVLRPSDDVTDKLAGLPKHQVEIVQKFIADIAGKKDEAELPTKNISGHSIAVYAREGEGVELFISK